MGRYREGPEFFEAGAKGSPEAFLVDNSQLKADARGIAYRQSMSLKDKDRKIAEFGSVVHGTQRCSEDGTMWLQVQNLYLPMKVADKDILLPVWWDRARASHAHAAPEDPVLRHVNRTRAALATPAPQQEVETETFDSPPEVRPLIPGTGCLYEDFQELMLSHVSQFGR